MIFAGAGSHASYFEHGEYVTQVPLPALRPVRGSSAASAPCGATPSARTIPGTSAARLEGALSIPFVDYARGDGLAVGPGGDIGWTAILVDDTMGWVDGFRGLWGLDTRDRFAGERAPAGPKYTRNGTARQSWNDPLGFLGLDKLPPPGRMPAVLERADRGRSRPSAPTAAWPPRPRPSEIRRLTAAVPVRTREVVEVTGPTKDELALRVGGGGAGGDARRRCDARRRDRGGRARARAARDAGDLGDPRAHLRHDQRPQPEEEHRYGRLVEFWSAISAGALLIFIVAALYLGLLGPVRGRRGRDRRLRRDRGGDPAPAHRNAAAGDARCSPSLGAAVLVDHLPAADPRRGHRRHRPAGDHRQPARAALLTAGMR